MPKIEVKTWSTPAVEEERRFVPCAVCGSLAFKPGLACGNFAYVRCVRCGLTQMNPQPVPEAVQRRYGEAYGADYFSYETAHEAAFLQLQIRSLRDAGFFDWEKTLLPSPEAAPPHGAPRFLDIGCATGALLQYVRERGWEVQGVEISPPQAEYARRERGLAVSALPLEENRFSGNFFTAVHASHLIEHLNDPASLVREARRILAPGGRFWVTTPNIAGFQARLFGSRWRSAIFDHLYLFSTKTLTALLHTSGLRKEKIVTWGGLAAGTAPTPVKRIADRLAKCAGAGDVMLIRAVKDSV
ncbi:MAG: class I SAM-dependent methyltransferase [Treponema sp.]|jgi:SAM-dependent methyltransferase|nr:class I SAM-dependent methyltransferase [Treponema sp.]